MQQGPWGIDPAADRPKVLASPALIFAAVLIAGFILDWLWPMEFLPQGWSLVIGFFLVFIAINIKTYAVREMVKLSTNLSVRKPTNAIATEWPFSVSRNPIYAGIILLNIGVACFVNALPILLLTPVLVLALQKGVIEPEERYLEQKFGDKYLRYKAKVRRWI
ncbi:MAG: isoprenylcysteine carboxylmethyltransferase family protein [Beijerinckiaceae bacterium]|nr:isoprenylcysteine carboxylmethyltransferase family protein [Beijerinckiaceae bacterium]